MVVNRKRAVQRSVSVLANLAKDEQNLLMYLTMFSDHTQICFM